MPFLSLGLLNDEKQGDSLRESPMSPLGTAGDSDRNLQTTSSDTRTSALPPALDELRQKLSDLDKDRTPKSAPLAASVSSLSAAERGWVPSFGTFKFGYLPGRGLLYSAIGHELALFCLFLLFTYGLPRMAPQRLVVRTSSQDHLIYLPEIGGGSEGQKSPGGGESAPQESSAAPAHASKGFAYPGPQPILSDPPNPTNTFQTIQRPLLVHPETVRKLVPLPNIVQMAETRLPSDLIAPKPAMPQVREVPKPIRVKQDTIARHEAKWKVPVTDAPKLEASAELPKLPAAEEPLPEAPKVEPQPKQDDQKIEVEKPSAKPIKVTAEKRAEKAEKQVSPPSAAQIARTEMHGKAKEPLLSLSPMPLPQVSDAKIPAGEARGRFAIAPGGTLNPNSINPGTPNSKPSLPSGTGQVNSQGPNAATEVASTAGSGAGHNPALGGGSGNARVASGAGSRGTGTGSGTTSGAGTGGSGSGKGRGNKGNGSGTSGGLGAGTGSGAGSGSGSGSFPGITIQGGADDTSGVNAKAFSVEPQTTYAMTVVSTASSGGGLADFGVFEDERVYTVYIPMKRSPDEADPTWTLQYALLESAAMSADQPVLAPVAVVREWPRVPAELEKKYGQQQVIIYAIVDAEGKVNSVKVMQTPDRRVSDAIAQAFAKWRFRPAQLDGRPVSVKILVGIPL